MRSDGGHLLAPKGSYIQLCVSEFPPGRVCWKGFILGSPDALRHYKVGVSGFLMS